MMGKSLEYIRRYRINQPLSGCNTTITGAFATNTSAVAIGIPRLSDYQRLCIY